ncbi:MAG: hypothetical protein H0T79_21465 [Deltaproteobacteria bacterium]|nr:hypothetical protein [Deltaproteobacteria bacterium]
MRRVLPIALALTGACGSFESEDVVLDLRILAMTATLPEQMVDVDLADPGSIMPAALLDQLAPSEVCVLVAEPDQDRRLRYTLTLCPDSGDRRCNSGDPQVVLASGLLDDPDTTIPTPRLCATIQPDGNLLGVLLRTIEGDSLGGLAGVDYAMTLQIGGEDDDPALDAFGAKTIRVSPRIPATRAANMNPFLERIDIMIDDVTLPLPLGRCVDQPAPLEIAAGSRPRLTPIEPDGVREPYVVPRLEGGVQMLVETLTYQWLTGHGGFSAGSTGGNRDIAGNPPPLFTDFKAPTKELDGKTPLAGPIDVPLWIVQRDERLGSKWYESCLRIVP